MHITEPHATGIDIRKHELTVSLRLCNAEVGDEVSCARESLPIQQGYEA